MKLFFCISFIFSLCYLTPNYAQTTQEQTAPIQFDKVIYGWSPTIAEAFYYVDKKYYETVNPEASIIQSIKAFIKNLDPHSDFMDPKTYTEIMESTQGEFGGIGIVIDHTKKTEDETLTVVDTMPAKGADKAGIKANDKIVQINNETLKGMSVDEIRAKLKGKPGSTVQIKIIRPGNKEMLNLQVTRELIQEQNAICYYFNQQNIYYLGLNMFTENSVKQLEQLLKKAHSQKSKGIILDLRNNSGGLLSAVLDIAGLFLKKNSLLVTTKNREKKVLEQYRTTREPITQHQTPIFILTNNYTASAAEILAGCLQYYSEQDPSLLVFLVGSKTFGKGSVQEVIPISNDCALKLTTALYYLPNDISIQGVGIKPDFAIEPRFPAPNELNWLMNNFGYESTLKNTIKNDESSENKQREEKEKSWEERKKEQINNDYIILNSMRLIEMLNLGQKAYPQQLKTRKDIVQFLNKNYTFDNIMQMEEIKI